MERINIADKVLMMVQDNGLDLYEVFGGGREEGDRWKVMARAITGDLLFYIMNGDRVVWKYDIEKIIFSHDFAKAFWPDRESLKDVSFTMLYGVGGIDSERPNDFYWKYQLQQLVISKDPILYLEKFI